MGVAMFFRIVYFNCTIQELKQEFFGCMYPLSYHFNCTIQELKREKIQTAIPFSSLFQLHHTGIKTWLGKKEIGSCSHFNCTIQELKHEQHA